MDSKTFVYSVPAIILRSPHHVGLGITRSLGRLGVRVYNVDSTRWAPAFFSKYSARGFTWDFENASEQESVQFLTGLARRIGSRAVLIPTTDRAAVFVADHQETLRKGFIFPPQAPLLIRSLCNKNEMQKLARRAGIPVPETAVPQTRAELLSCFRESKYPLIVKSIDSRFRKHKSRTKAVIRNRQEAFSLYDQIDDSVLGNLIVQDWIPKKPGTDWIFNGYFDKRSNCVAAFSGRKLRQYPPDIGVTSLGVCQRNETIEELAINFLKSLCYRGPVDMDFRYDERDCQYKLLDVNPRVGGSFRLFASKEGLDIARVLYLDQIGESLPASRVEDGHKWMVEDYDIVTSFRYLREGKLSIREWLRSLQEVQEFGFFSMNDPLPAILMLRDDLSELLELFHLLRRPVGPFESEPRAAVSKTSLFTSRGPYQQSIELLRRPAPVPLREQGALVGTNVSRSALVNVDV